MHALDSYLQSLIDSDASELRLEPNKNPYLVTKSGRTDVAADQIPGKQISMMVFPLIPQDMKKRLPEQPEVEFRFANELGDFNFIVQKSPAGFNVSIAPITAPDAAKVSDSLKTSEMIVPAAENAVAPHPPIDATDPPVAKPAEASIAKDATAMIPPVADFASSASPSHFFGTGGERAASAMSARIDSLLRILTELGGSALHLSVGQPPLVRKSGELHTLESGDVELTLDLIAEMLFPIMPGHLQADFESRNDADFAYEIADLGRFRCNLFADRKGIGAVFRTAPNKLPSADELNLPKAITELTLEPRGLVLISGPSGSGKSTTLAALLDKINSTRAGHIVTIEDPIEFVHESKMCLVNQREIGLHTASAERAVAAALREDADIIAFGELGNREMIVAAIEAASSGALVLATITAQNAGAAVSRLAAAYALAGHSTAADILADSIAAVAVQRRVGRGKKRPGAEFSIFVNSPDAAQLIRGGRFAELEASVAK